MRRFFSPSWLLRHLLAIFLIVLFARLGWWQLVKGQSDRGTLQNLFYGFEWPVFAAAVTFFWWRMVREELRPRESGEQAAVRAAPPLPPSASANAADRSVDDPDDEEDAELAAYNRYLAALHEADEANARASNR